MPKSINLKNQEVIITTINPKIWNKVMGLTGLEQVEIVQHKCYCALCSKFMRFGTEIIRLHGDKKGQNWVVHAKCATHALASSYSLSEKTKPDTKPKRPTQKQVLIAETDIEFCSYCKNTIPKDSQYVKVNGRRTRHLQHFDCYKRKEAIYKRARKGIK